MGILSRSLGIHALSMEDPSQPLLPMSALFESLGLGRSDAGVMVNEKQAMRVSTAFGCVTIISEDLSRLSLDIYQRIGDSVRISTEHRLYGMLHDRPNPNMSSMVWRGAQLASMCAYGNAYSWIKRDKAARPIGLYPLASDKTAPVWVNGELMYATTQTPNGRAVAIDPWNILHFRGMSLDGILGLSPIQTCKNVFGLSLAAEKFGAQFFGNGARASGVLSHPGSLETEAYENLKKSVREWATGEAALRPIILEEGMKWEQITIPPDDAQFLETRKFQRSEVAALYRVPLHLLQELERSTNNNIEHQSLDYVRFCLAPKAVNVEQEINYKLLSGPYTCEHNFRDLERGDFKSQADGLLALRSGGVYSTNDVLRALRQNPISAEEGGDVRIVQGANIPLSSLVAMEDQPAAPELAQTNTDQGDPAADMRRRQITASFRPMFRDAVGRAIHRGGDADFTARALYPAIVSMTTTVVASRFGSADLTKKELGLVTAQARAIAQDAGG
jgi:HK97 family phage portal protein